MSEESCKPCANVGELRAMMEDVAEKAAERTADRITAELKLEIAKGEHRLQDSLSKEIDKKFQNYLGMTSQEHAIEHDRMKGIINTFSSINSKLWQRIATALLLLALGAGVGKGVPDFKALTPKLPPHQQMTEESKNEPHK